MSSSSASRIVGFELFRCLLVAVVDCLCIEAASFGFRGCLKQSEKDLSGNGSTNMQSSFDLCQDLSMAD